MGPYKGGVDFVLAIAFQSTVAAGPSISLSLV